MKRQLFLVAFDVPRGATVAEVENYVENAVRAHCGGLDPAEPMFDLDRGSVAVQRVKMGLLK